MTPEIALEHACDKPDFLALSGSRLYGTARYDEAGNCLSDFDYRGWTLPPVEYLFLNPARGFTEREISRPPEGDHKIVSLHKFLSELLKNDPQLLELLFAPESHVIHISPVGRELLTMRGMFITKQFFWRITGYGNSEWRKARAVKLEITEPPKTLDEILAWIRNTIQPDKTNMDQVVLWLTEHLPRKEVPSHAGINGKRREEYAKFGYCTSSACHSIRLMKQCTEFLETGYMTFPRPEAALLKDIKHGRMKIEDIEPIYVEAKAKCEEAFAASKLPDAIDKTKVWMWYEQICKKVARKELL
jgi:hypothetical protein